MLSMELDLAPLLTLAGTLVGAASALVGGFISDRQRGKREEAAFEREREEKWEAEGKSLLKHLAELEQFFWKRSSSEDYRKGMYLPPDLEVRMRVEIGVLHSAEHRRSLERGLAALAQIPNAYQMGMLGQRAAIWVQRGLTQAMTQIAAAAARGEKTNQEDIETVDRAHLWAEQAWEILSEE